MAGKTFLGDIIGQLDHLGSMRITVTPETVVQIVVSLAGMALTAERDDLLYRRWMPGMAILAADTGLMGPAVCCDVRRRRHMALYTVGIAKEGPVSS